MTKSHINIWFLLIFICDVICGILYLYIYVADIDIRYCQNDDWDTYKKKIQRNGLLSYFVAIAFFCKNIDRNDSIISLAVREKISLPFLCNVIGYFFSVVFGGISPTPFNIKRGR